MGEIGEFSAFSKPKQLFAYFGLDPAVKQSGKFEGTKVQMSKRGSAIARRVIHTLTLQSISISRNGEAKNSVLREYYIKKCDSKPKLVAMGAVSHKVCNMIFAILRDNKPFKIIAPRGAYQTIQCCQMRHSCIKYCKFKESISFKTIFSPRGKSALFSQKQNKFFLI